MVVFCVTEQIYNEQLLTIFIRHATMTTINVKFINNITLSTDAVFWLYICIHTLITILFGTFIEYFVIFFSGIGSRLET